MLPDVWASISSMECKCKLMMSLIKIYLHKSFLRSGHLHNRVTPATMSIPGPTSAPRRKPPASADPPESFEHSSATRVIMCPHPQSLQHPQNFTGSSETYLSPVAPTEFHRPELFGLFSQTQWKGSCRTELTNSPWQFPGCLPGLSCLTGQFIQWNGKWTEPI